MLARLGFNVRVDFLNPQALIGRIFVVVGGSFFIEFLIEFFLSI